MLNFLQNSIKYFIKSEKNMAQPQFCLEDAIHQKEGISQRSNQWTLFIL